MENMKLIAKLCLLALLLPVAMQARTFARWHTNMGSFTAEMYEEIVPITVNNFIRLTNDGFYNNKIFHRVVAGFVIQDGCPFGTGYGGPGWTIQDEFSPLLNHNQAGTLAMARTSSPNSAGSQYYITLAPTPDLNGNYAVFGKIISGLDTVLAIGNVPVGANSRPIDPVNIYQLRMLDLQIASVYPATTDTIPNNPGTAYTFMVEASTVEAAVSYSWYVNEVMQEGQSDMLFESMFPASGDYTVRCNVSSTDSIATDVVWHVRNSTAVTEQYTPAVNQTILLCSPNPFSSCLELSYKQMQNAPVSFDIFNLKGQKVISLSSTANTEREGRISWDGRDCRGNICPSGTYIIRMIAGDSFIVQKSYLVH